MYPKKKSTPKFDRRVMFNRDVLEALEKASPNHAISLRRQGEALEWWIACDYARTSGKGVQDAVDYILSKDAPIKLEEME
jgi:hypothetical protein